MTVSYRHGHRLILWRQFFSRESLFPELYVGCIKWTKRTKKGRYKHIQQREQKQNKHKQTRAGGLFCPQCLAGIGPVVFVVCEVDFGWAFLASRDRQSRRGLKRKLLCSVSSTLSRNAGPKGTYKST